MNRRNFFTQLASGIVVAAAPAVFLPKLIKPAWKVPKNPVLLGIYSHVEDGLHGFRYVWSDGRETIELWQMLYGVSHNSNALIRITES